MAGFMEGYGQKEQTRSRLLKRIFGIGIPAILLIVIGFFYFRTWSQERAMQAFLGALSSKNYTAAYGMWCNAEHPCPYYPMDQFQKDWGPDGEYKDVAKLSFENVDYCGQGVVFETNYPGAKPFGLWVERATNVIGFAPEQRCPGRHLHLAEFFHRIFG